jgi:alpha-tubulin suppressor-like RCC1 family protein
MSGNRKVVAGNGYTCALVGAGKISCWGYNGSGQLGIDEPVEDVFNPSYVLGISNAVDIAAKHSHTCALLDNGTIKCWGYNSSGQLGDGTTSTRRSPVLVSDISTATQVVVEYNHTCAVLEDRTVKCWGADYGSVPVLVPALSNVTQITAGYNHTCAVLEDGTAKCWGDNAQGQLGNNSTTDSLTPVSVSNISTATQITAGRLYTLQP